jgi:hypothetical protein
LKSLEHGVGVSSLLPLTTKNLLNLTELETAAVVRGIAPELLRYANQYDEKKYPPAELARLRAVFATPDSVLEPDIVAALVWKYGHTGKANYPKHQRALAARIAKLWSTNAMLPAQDPMDAFSRWRALLGPTSFITVCFLLHLVQPDAVPILDQHNYRSVTLHLATVRPGLGGKAKPSQFSDLLLVRDFGLAVLGGWERYSTSEKPPADVLDRYLMMHGKAHKPRRIVR